jgi:hypothetical protein
VMNVIKTIHLMYEVENVMETMDKSNILNCELKKNVYFFFTKDVIETWSEISCSSSWLTDSENVYFIL